MATVEKPLITGKIVNRCLGPYTDDVDTVLKELARVKHKEYEKIKEAVDTVRGNPETYFPDRDDAVRDPKTGKIDPFRITTGPVVRSLIRFGNKEVAIALTQYSRPNCGHDLTPEIEALPEDGESHDFECPVCGAKHHATRVPVVE